MWRLKGKEEDPTLKRLAMAINSHNGSNLVTIGESTFYSSSLTFFSDFKLIVFIDLSFCPYLEIRLLDNGKTSFILDGTQNPFVEASSISPLLLTSENVYQYAALVLGNMYKNDNSYRLVTSVDDIYFSEEPTKEQYQLLESSIRMADIKKVSDSYQIETAMLLGDSVYKVSLNISFDGHVDIIKENVLHRNMPIRELVLD